MKDPIEREDAIKYCKLKADHYRKRLARIEAQGDAISYDPTEQINGFKDEIAIYESFVKELEDIPSAEPNLILPERMERGECYEVGETIVVLNHDDYYDLLCKAMENEPKQGEWIDKGWHGDWQFEIDGRGNCWKVFECSNCNCHARHITPFCPNCGAHMKGVDNEKNY